MKKFLKYKEMRNVEKLRFIFVSQCSPIILMELFFQGKEYKKSTLLAIAC
jgi:hypothetical protein